MLQETVLGAHLPALVEALAVSSLQPRSPGSLGGDRARASRPPSQGIWTLGHRAAPFRPAHSNTAARSLARHLAVDRRSDGDSSPRRHRALAAQGGRVPHQSPIEHLAVHSRCSPVGLNRTPKSPHTRKVGDTAVCSIRVYFTGSSHRTSARCCTVAAEGKAVRDGAGRSRFRCVVHARARARPIRIPGPLRLIPWSEPPACYFMSGRRTRP